MMPPFKKSIIMTNEGNLKQDDDQNMKIQTYLSVCNICGQCHSTHECPFLQNLHYINDTPVLSRARQTLPKDLEITKMADGTLSIITKREFQRGTTFGPLQGKRNWAMNPVNSFPIKICGHSNNDIYYLDYSDEDYSNWMSFILPASNAKEQNLICYQIKFEIFYTVMRFIPAGEELRVWYAPYYALKMQMPLYNSDFTCNDSSFSQSPVNDHPEPGSHQENRNLELKKNLVEILSRDIASELAEKLPAAQLGAKSDQKHWTCRLCSSNISSVVSYAKHLMEHYKPLLGAYCNLCNKKYYNNSVLEKHKAQKHAEVNSDSSNNDAPHKDPENTDSLMIPSPNNVPDYSIINTSNNNVLHKDAEDMKGILDKLKPGNTDSTLMIPDKENQCMSLIDSNDNMNDLLQNSKDLIENSSLKSILENQCLNINLSALSDAIMPENISDSKFNVDELTSDLSLDITADIDQDKQQQDKLAHINSFDCDICNKKFQRSDYLYRHLRKHTGEFICSGCLAVFARKENLLSHTCTSQKVNVSFECPYCQKNFAVKKYLKRHMVQHFEFNRCKWCRNAFSTSKELEAHQCIEPKHVCSFCNKVFVHRAHLNRHIKLHSDPKPLKRKKKKNVAEEKPAICEKCGDIFKTPYSLKQHLRSHGERTYECDICQRRFHRIGVLKEHKAIHQSAQIPCNICGKQLKSKKALDVHVLLHGNKKFQCEKCDKSFFQRCNYLKHYKQVHSEKTIHKCPHCSTQFANEGTFNKHLASHLKPSRFSCSSCHKSFHGAYQLKRHIQTSHSGIVYRCPYCKMTARHRHSMRRHFERQHKNLSDEWDKPGFVNQLTEKSADEKSNEKLSNVDNHDQIMLSHSGVDKAYSEFPRVDGIDGIDERTTLNSSEMLIQTHINNHIIENSEIALGDVPQLSIVDTDSQLAESVLSNAYIFEEDGDIMFYVLDNNSVISGY